MPVWRLVFLALSVASCLSAQYIYYLPQISDGVTSNGNIKTTLVVANVAKTAANLRIAVTREDSSTVALTFSGLGTGASFSTRLPAGATRLWTTDAHGDGSPVAAVITSDAALRVSAIVSNTTSSGETLSESTVSAIAKEDLSGNYMAAVDTTGGSDSGLALFNPATVGAQIAVRLLSGTGEEVNSTVLTLRPNSRVTVLGSQLAGSNFRGTLDATSSVPLAGFSVRQNASLPTYTLAPAPDRTSLGLSFNLPVIVDGHSDSSVTKTTFLLTNVSAKPASVELSLTQDDGAPFTVSIDGAGSDHAFKTNVAPGATVFLQTDGGSEHLVSGAAKIRSDRPMNVAAVITSFDASGGLVSETAVAPGPRNFQFAIPFENAGGAGSGAVFFNPTKFDLEVTVELADQDGKALASTRLAPIAAGARVTAFVSDLFPDAPASGLVRVSTGLLEPSLCVFAIRQSVSNTALSAGPAFTVPWTSTRTPTAVRPTLETTRRASASIGPAGGSLTVTDTKGNRFTLTIPPQALVSSQTITMTAIGSATGFSGPGFIAGVQLEPDGLSLLQPALLKIDTAGPLPDGALPVGWRGDTPGIYLNAVSPRPESLTLALNHFSGAGMAGLDLTSELLSLAGILELSTARALYWGSLGRARAAAIAFSDEEAEAQKRESARAFEKFREIVEELYELAIKPLLEFAKRTDDTDVMACAIQHTLNLFRSLQFWGFTEEGPVSGTSSVVITDEAVLKDNIVGYVSDLYQKRQSKLLKKCQEEHDFTAYYELQTNSRQAVSLGLNAFDDTGSLENALAACLPQVQLDYRSKVTHTSTVGGLGTINFEGTIEGSLVADGQLTKQSLSIVKDPSKDLTVPFFVQGAATETYNISKLTVTSTAAGLPCQFTVRNTAARPSTMTVRCLNCANPESSDRIKSQVEFAFDPQYNPVALTLGGQQLCSFCPVFRKKPVKVELYLDPGAPAESSQLACGNSVQPYNTGLWIANWSFFHSGAQGFIGDWVLTNSPDLLAQKTLTFNGSISGAAYQESTELKLKPCTGPAENNKCTQQ